MLGFRLFLNEYKKIQTWKTFLLTPIVFYLVSVSIIQSQTILSLLTNFTFFHAVKLIFYIYINPLDSFSLFNLFLFLVTTLLFTTNLIALKLYASRSFFSSSNVISFSAVVGALFGCLACCGSLVVVFILGFFGVGLSSLPFLGREIGVIALFIVIGSFVYTVSKIQAPIVCD